MTTGRTLKLAGAAALVAALALAGTGIWTRRAAFDRLQAHTDAAALTTVQAISPTRGPPTQSLSLPGQVAAWNEAQIFGQVSGYVKDWTKDYGARVTAGEVLATISTPTLDAEYRASEAKLKVAEAQSSIAALTASRFNALKDSPGVSQQTIDDRNATAAAAEAEVAAARQQVENYKARLVFKELKSPFAGVVTARRVNVGDYIDSSGSNGGGESTPRQRGEPPFSVADIHKLRVFVQVPQTYANILKPGLAAEVQLPGGTGRKTPARFLTQAGSVVASTRTITTEFVIDRPDGALVPGAFVRATMTFPSDPDVLVVPSQALLFRAEGMQVAVIGADDRVRLRKVTVGRNLGLTTQLREGLAANERIVANPSLGLLDGQQVRLVQATEGYQPGARRDTPPSPPSGAARRAEGDPGTTGK